MGRGPARLHLSVSLQAPPHEPVVGLLEGGYIAYVIHPHFFKGGCIPPSPQDLRPWPHRTQGLLCGGTCLLYHLGLAKVIPLYPVNVAYYRQPTQFLWQALCDGELAVSFLAVGVYTLQLVSITFSHGAMARLSCPGQLVSVPRSEWLTWLTVLVVWQFH